MFGMGKEENFLMEKVVLKSCVSETKGSWIVSAHKTFCTESDIEENKDKNIRICRKCLPTNLLDTGYRCQEMSLCNNNKDNYGVWEIV